MTGPPAPELQWAREVIDRQVQQMTRLVDDLLNVSRITRGKIELRRERVELAAVVKSAVEVSRSLIEKWGHELTVMIPPSPLCYSNSSKMGLQLSCGVCAKAGTSASTP
ncbi:MAG: hypothetical protein L0Z68_08760 [Gammaproteobacteria bacterium]|nr:hypothetical protein [Gammaproteobacteria bacterium]